LDRRPRHRAWEPRCPESRTAALTGYPRLGSSSLESIRIREAVTSERVSGRASATRLLTQAELGDVLGLSTVHVNRVIKQPRVDGLVTWSEKRIAIEDWAHLQQVAEFDPTFLNLEHEPW
jgi:hypothetical protein